MAKIPAQSAHARLSAEHGVTLIETLISAVILVMVVGATLTMIDVGSRTTAANRARSVASTLAEQDQEKLRGLPAPALANYHSSSTVTVDQNDYQVFSDSDWIYDATGATESCTNKTTQANYIRISSTVSSGVVGNRVKPITVRSLVAPRVGDYGANQGTLAVLVKDELDHGVPNVAVDVAGPDTYMDYTNDFGCAVFGHIPVGTYAATLNTPGWVDKNRNQISTQTNAVSAGTTALLQMSYARAAQIDTVFETKVGATPVKPAKGNALTVANSSVPSSGIVQFTSPTAPAASPVISATKLFPFPSGYTAYAGDCLANDPTKYDATYYSTYPGFTLVTPGATVPVTVREPAFNMQVLDKTLAGPTVPGVGAHVVVTLNTPGCAATKFVFTADATGKLPEPGLPFGFYDVCVDDANPLPALRRFQTTGTKPEPINNTSPAGTAFESDGTTPAARFTIDHSLSGGSPIGTCS
jgi:Tfp pilus assembly protein PilV